jgi:prepilin-type processing-associated H-X9-DG protein/prepilin-type N-terminal cleavage/methylation domain-containing protein
MKPARNFTLIELLIVIAIIAILASMLLPTLGRARELGKRITCVNQMKQIGTAALSYVNDFDGNWAAWSKNYSQTVSEQIQRGQWMTILAEYVGGNGLMWVCPNAKFGEFSDRYDVLQVNRDPYATNNSLWLNPMNSIMTIGINARKFGYASSPDKLRGVKSWSRLIYAMDNVGNNSAYDPKNTNGGRYCTSEGGKLWPEDRRCPNPCHLNTANMLFADGHVESIGKPELRIMGSTEVNTYWLGR